jgi:3-oxoadipate CoA-transferase, beta subunit
MALSRVQIAWRAAQDIPDGAVVNLGIGMPVQVSNYLPPDRDVFFQSENGVIGVGPAADPEAADPDLVDAGSRQITLRRGGCVVDSVASFAMIRGGHIDITVLGAFEVAQNGDLANWNTLGSDRGPLVGGAMDLALGARETWVIMAHNTRDGAPRLRKTCTLPLTARACVTRIYTDIAVVDVTPEGLRLRELLPGVTQSELLARTEAAISIPDGLNSLDVPSL